MNKKLYFISDLHLGLQSKQEEAEKEEVLVNFLHSINVTGNELFILGDLFDYWFEYNRVYQKGFFRTFTALDDLVKNGVVVHYIIGNHDFVHKNFFEKELNIKLYPDSISKNINGTNFFLAHGDGMVENDFGYTILKFILRNKFLQFLYSLIHPDLAIKIASGASKKSRNHSAKKNKIEKDGLVDSAQKKIDEGFNYVIFGHLHKRNIHKYKNGFYINLGSWIEKPCYGLFENNKFEIIDL